MVKNMQNPELSPAACLSHCALPGQRRSAGPGTGSTPHFCMAPGQGPGLAVHSLPFSEPFLLRKTLQTPVSVHSALLLHNHVHGVCGVGVPYFPMGSGKNKS